jgi:CelD/BcsL family acetyltransferase involved in cellulose biosynthesis
MWLAHEISVRTPGSVLVLTVHRGDRLVGYAGLVRAQHRLALRLPRFSLPVFQGEILRLLGGTAVVSAEDAPAVHSALAAWLAKADSLPRTVLLEEVMLPSSAAEAFSGAARPSAACSSLDQPGWRIHPGPGVDQRTWFVDVGGGFDLYNAQFSSKRRSALKRQGRRLREKHPELELMRVREPHDVARYLALFDELYRRTWHFSSSPRNWMQPETVSTMKALAARGWLRSYAFVADGRAIAVAHGTCYRGEFVLEDVAYDEEEAAHSPGTVLLYEAIADLFTVDPPGRISFGFGNNQYKEVLGRACVPASNLYAVRGLLNHVRFGLLDLYNHALRYHRRARATASD